MPERPATPIRSRFTAAIGSPVLIDSQFLSRDREKFLTSLSTTDQKSGGFLMIADPLWSRVMLLCGPLLYLVITHAGKHNYSAVVITVLLQNSSYYVLSF